MLGDSLNSLTTRNLLSRNMPPSIQSGASAKIENSYMSWKIQLLDNIQNPCNLKLQLLIEINYTGYSDYKKEQVG